MKLSIVIFGIPVITCYLLSATDKLKVVVVAVSDAVGRPRALDGSGGTAHSFLGFDIPYYNTAIILTS